MGAGRALAAGGTDAADPRAWRRYAELRARVLEQDMIVDGVHYVNEAYNSGKRIITEGASHRCPLGACVRAVAELANGVLRRTLLQVPMRRCWTWTSVHSPL